MLFSISPISISDDDPGNNLFIEIIEKPTLNPRFVSQPQITSTPEFQESLRLKEKEYDLILKLTDEKGKCFNTRFCFENQASDGFVVYSYDRSELIRNFWERFEKEEQKIIIERLRHNIIPRIKREHPADTEPFVDDELIKNYVIDKILNSFFHHAKRLYHEHETHGTLDGRYNPYYYSKERNDGGREYLREIPSLSTKNNPAINWFIDQFEKSIVSNVKNISRQYYDWSEGFRATIKLKERITEALKEDDKKAILSLISEIRIMAFDFDDYNENNPPEFFIPKSDEFGETIEEIKEHLIKFYRSSFYALIKHYYEALEVISKECIDCLIEYTYCKTLLESKYNDEYKYDSELSESELSLLSTDPCNHPRLVEKDSRRNKAFNIQNSIKYIEVIQQKCSFWEFRISELELDVVYDISNNNKNILEEIKNNNIVLEELQELTVKTGKNNDLNSFLGWLALCIAFIGLIDLDIALLWKWFCCAGAFVTLVIAVLSLYKKKTPIEKNSN